jgi:hypothetical protein
MKQAYGGDQVTTDPTAGPLADDLADDPTGSLAILAAA